MITAQEMRKMVEEEKRMEEKLLRSEGRRWVLLHEDDLKASCGEGSYFLPFHTKKGVNVYALEYLKELGYEVLPTSEGIIIKW